MYRLIWNENHRLPLSRFLFQRTFDFDYFEMCLAASKPTEY